MRQIERTSDAMRDGARGLHASLTPAMYGCPDCRTAWVIASTASFGDCADCGTPMTVLTVRQVEAAIAF